MAQPATTDHGSPLSPVLESQNSSIQRIDSPKETPRPPKKGLDFWMVFVAVSTALPTIIHDLHGEDFIWVASAYNLASTALLPASGGVAEPRLIPHHRTWSCAASIGPLVGGALAQGGQWRWLFCKALPSLAYTAVDVIITSPDLNLPVTGLAAVLVFACLKLRTPPGTLREKLGRMDWV
ncbi:hypothetical protein PHLCEN_2v8512 [Hermanssonia centrifuga]|uniref:Major facilitator superfamily (MFS) profile domain-containing protein n=1 Tax=Hermanssonia centrifuga TaxID=98765 RepID=A0A2R6NTE0_9APHY|nr:hypothetical protein PHLCEN_2v8512 [Hermanssonia centrifuga]